MKEVTNIAADVWTFPLKVLYDKTRRTVTGKSKDERELGQVEETLPEETAVWMPQRPESEAEPEQRGGSTDSPPAHDHGDGHASEDGLEVMQEETLVGREEASTTAPPAATDVAVDEGVPRLAKALGTGGEFARRD